MNQINQWHKGVVSWKCGDSLYLSVPFTWLLDDARRLAKLHGGRVVAGGPAVVLRGAPWAETPAECSFDVLAMHNPHATFTTRGCPNKCGFCAVPKIEGDFVELPTWKPAPMICDNNLLAASRTHFTKVIESLKSFPTCDFNQGLDARLFTKWHAELLASLRRPTIRFAFDHVNEEAKVVSAIEIARSAGLSKFAVYVLIGFNDTPEDALYRLRTVVKLGALPCPMRYQPLDADTKNGYVATGWTEHELRRMTRYFWKYRFLRKTPYEEFRPSETPSARNLTRQES